MRSACVDRVDRFWVPVGTPVPVDEDGFLRDLSRPTLAGRRSSQLQVLAALEDVPCLILLGDAGMGKSCELEAERHRLDTVPPPTLVQLSLEDSSTYLDTRLSSELNDLVQGEHILHLLLDALDEARVDAHVMGIALADLMRRLSAETRRRLRLRITCRTSVWPAFHNLEAELRKLWEPEALAVYELAPLRWGDVARLHGSALRDALWGMPEAKAFARSPQELSFLSEFFRTHGTLPTSVRELYEEGCYQLCAVDAKDPSRNLTASQRLGVAARTATFTLLTRRPSILIGSRASRSRSGLVLDDLVTREEVALQPGTPSGDRFTVTAEGIEETCARSRLFCGSERGRAFSHRAFAEALAAWRLSLTSLDRAELLELMRHNAGGRREIVPELWGLAAWLASYDRQVLEQLVRDQPELLLAADILDLDHASKAALVTALLERVQQRRLRPARLRGPGLARLRFDGLADLLREPIQLADAPETLCAAALRIAVACRVDESFVGELLDLALDPSRPTHLRVLATTSVGRWGTREQRAGLKTLARGGAGEDPEDALKGAALDALWPEDDPSPDPLLTDVELFGSLTPYKRENLFGDYKYFVHVVLLPRIAEVDILPALDWLQGRFSQASHRGVGWRDVEDTILRSAWRHDDERTSTALARVVIEGLGLGRSIHTVVEPEGWSAANDVRRRGLIQKMVVVQSAAGAAPEWARGRLFDWIRPDDAHWLVEQVRAAHPGAERRAWVYLLRDCVFLYADDPLEVVCSLVADFPEAADVFRNWVGPIEFGSDEAMRMRKDHEWRVRRQALAARERELQTPVARMREVRDTGGRAQAAWFALLHADAGGDPVAVAESEWWEALDEQGRDEVLAAAEAYLRDPPAEQPWLATGRYPATEVAGLAAILLLEEVSAGASEGLQRWLGILLAWPKHDSHQLAALKRAAVGQEREVAKLVTTALRWDGGEGPSAGGAVAPEILDLVWNEDLGAGLERLVRDRALVPGDLSRVLARLLAHEGTRVAAEELAYQIIEDASESDELAAGVAEVLLARNLEAAWSRIWSMMQDRESFGRAFVEHLAQRPDELLVGTLANRLDERHVADLYMWLDKVHPTPEAAPRQTRRTVRAVTPEWLVRHWRDGLLTNLRDRGTEESVEALRRIREANPELEWLEWTINEASQRARSRGWQPLAPEEVRSVIDDDRTPWVRDVDDLFGAVIRGLAAYQALLRGHGPHAKELWDLKPEPRHKTEPECNEVVAARVPGLIERGVSATCEPQLRHSWGPGTGRRADIVFHGTTRAGEEVRVVAECKGAWHKDVGTALDSQLVDGYLADDGHSHGIYLVYWFGGVGRLGGSLESARARLEEQAKVAAERSGKRVAAVVLDARLGT